MPTYSLDFDKGSLVIDSTTFIPLSPYEYTALHVLHARRDNYVRLLDLPALMKESKQDLKLGGHSEDAPPDAGWQFWHIEKKVRKATKGAHSIWDIVERRPFWGYRWRVI